MFNVREREQIAHVQLPLSLETLLSEKNTGLQLNCGCLRKKENAASRSHYSSETMENVSSLCRAACMDTCVISLGGMATTIGVVFLQMFLSILAPKKKRSSQNDMFPFPFITVNA